MEVGSLPSLDEIGLKLSIQKAYFQAAPMALSNGCFQIHRKS
jgi:hypothetical protein